MHPYEVLWIAAGVALVAASLGLHIVIARQDRKRRERNPHDWRTVSWH